MTSQISKDIKTHVILTYAGSKIFINSLLEQKLRTLSDNDKIYVDDRMVRINTIKEILPIEEYYKEHPEERPRYNNYSAKKEHFAQNKEVITRERHINRLKSMLGGFEKHWSGKEMNKGAKKIHDYMLKTIKIYENNPNKPIENIHPGKIMGMAF